MQCHAHERTRTIFAYTTFGFNLTDRLSITDAQNFKESSPASSPSSNNVTYVPFSSRYIKIWKCLNEIIVQQFVSNNSCPGYSDIWPFCNNGFIFVMSTCQFLIRPGRGQGAGGRGQGPSAIPVSGLRRTAPQQPVATQQGACYHPVREPSESSFSRKMSLSAFKAPPCGETAPRVLASKTTADRHRQQKYSFAKTDLFKESRNWTEHMNCQKGSFFLYLIIHRYRH